MKWPVVALVLCVASGAFAAPGDKLNRSGFVLAFQSDFSKPVAAPTWTTCYAMMDVCASVHSRMLPGEAELYVDSAYCGVNPFSTAGPALVITARQATAAETAKCPGLSAARPFVSGMLTTWGSFSMVYGYAEMNAIFTGGQGCWPAFWAIPRTVTPANLGRVPEIDAVEMHQGVLAGYNGTNLPVSTLHTSPTSSVSNLHKEAAVSANAAHVYGFKRTPGLIQFYVDNVETWEQSYTNADPVYLVTDLAVDARYPNPTRCMMIVQYERAYILPPSAP